jgi:two-component system sensor histidine kinase KdpD
MIAEMAQGLESVPRRRVEQRGAMFEELDLPALLKRSRSSMNWPTRTTTTLGTRNAGINVISTHNIEHLESLNEVVTKITRVKQRETIPDAIARRAEQIELVDMTAEALRRRMVHGNIYPADRIDAALTHYFRPGNLTALRELAMLWMADRTEEDTV